MLYLYNYLPYIYHIFTIYLPYIYHIFTIYLPYIYHIFTIYLPYIYHIFTIYLPYIYHIFTIYLPYIYHIFTIYLPLYLPNWPPTRTTGIFGATLRYDSVFEDLPDVGARVSSGPGARCARRVNTVISWDVIGIYRNSLAHWGWKIWFNGMNH